MMPGHSADRSPTSIASIRAPGKTCWLMEQWRIDPRLVRANSTISLLNLVLSAKTIKDERYLTKNNSSIDVECMN